MTLGPSAPPAATASSPPSRTASTPAWPIEQFDESIRDLATTVEALVDDEPSSETAR
jgi:hypothetical protein